MSPVAQSVRNLITDPGVVRPIPAHTFVEIDHALFSMSILLLSLIQEKILSVTSERRIYPCGTVKRDFRSHIQRYTSPNDNFKSRYPTSNALLQCCLKLEHTGAFYPSKCDVFNAVKLFPTKYRRM